MQENYLNASVVSVMGSDPQFIRVYNTTASAVTNGTIVCVVKKWTTGVGVQAVMITPAENAAEANVIGIVNNPMSTGIAATSYGLVQIKGLYGSAASGTATAYGVTTSGTVTANMYLEVLSATQVFIDAGTLGGTAVLTNVCAIAVELIDTYTWSVYLFGRFCSVAAS